MRTSALTPVLAITKNRHKAQPQSEIKELARRIYLLFLIRANYSRIQRAKRF